MKEKMPNYMRFEKPTVNPNQMRNLALQELTVKRGSTKERAKRSLRIMLPAWLSGRTTQAAEKMEQEMERND